VMVAPWVHLLPAALEEEGADEVARPWLRTPIGWEAIKKHTDNFVAIFSDNDPFVPMSDSEIFKGKLGARLIVEHKAGHFCEDDDTTEVPVALKELLAMLKSV
jgi:predicted alpha/beta hydrolase family esterase